MLKITLVALLILLSYSQNAYLYLDPQQVNRIPIIINNELQPNFSNTQKLSECSMPQLYIYADQSHYAQLIKTDSIRIVNANGKWNAIQLQESAGQNSYLITGACTGEHQINWITLVFSNGIQAQYLVNCNPSTFYKPFELGLFLLLVFTSIAITLTSIYSRAWSYNNFGLEITWKMVILFNVVLIVALLLSYVIPDVFGMYAKLIGCSLGVGGVTVCSADIIWLTGTRVRRKWRFGLRIIDVVSVCIGVGVAGLYFFTQFWLLNDFLAVPTIIAVIKLLKIRSLKIALFLLTSLLAIQSIFSASLHYLHPETSYNNLIIQHFYSPLMVVMPSITPELQRKCAWLPITAFILPGLLLGYLRRYDRSRGKFLYLGIGCMGFYLGSLAWIGVDMLTKHAFPFAIISQPITFIVILIISIRRNESKTLWNGHFHDQQLPKIQQSLIKQTEIVSNTGEGYLNLDRYTQDLKLKEQTVKSSEFISQTLQ